MGIVLALEIGISSVRKEESKTNNFLFESNFVCLKPSLSFNLNKAFYSLSPLRCLVVLLPVDSDSSLSIVS